MKKWFASFIAILSVSAAYSQGEFWKKPDYGLNFDINLPIIKPVSGDTLSMKTEWGGSVFFEFGNEGKWGYQTALGFDRVKYNHNFLHETTVSNNLNLGLTAFFRPEKMQGTRFLFGIEPTYALTSRVQSLDGSKGSGTVTKSGELEKPFDLGLNAGLSLQFKPHLSLQFIYKEMLLSQPFSTGYDGIPDQFQVRVQVAFNKIEGSNGPNKREIAINHAVRLKDSSLLIFVLDDFESKIETALNKEDELLAAKLEEARNFQVNSIRQFYRYGSFIICYGNDFVDILNGDTTDKIESMTTDLLENGVFTEKMKNGPLVARIGDFLVDENQSPRAGVFVYSEKMILLEAPFPFYTAYPGLEPYLSDESKLNSMMMNFSEKMELFYGVR